MISVLLRWFLALALCAYLPLFAQPVIVQGPVVDAITYSSARISWITDQPANTQLRFSLSTLRPPRRSATGDPRIRLALDGANSGTDVNTVHSWYLSGLAQATTYTYQACSKNGGGEICSDSQTVTTAPAPASGTPAPPAPPAAYVDTSMPAGANGDPFVVDENCSNLSGILTRIASLNDDLNYEIQIPPHTTCYGQWMFPARPNHKGWIVVRTAGNLPPEGIRIGADDYLGMSRFVTDALPGSRFSPQSFPSTCVPGTYAWANGVADMGLHVCKPYTGSGDTKKISGYSSANQILTLPGHGYNTGDLVRITGTGLLDGFWQISVIDPDHIAVNGTLPKGKAFQDGGTVMRNNAWRLVPYNSGLTLPDTCASNDWFLKTDVTPVGGVYWCTSANTWTHVRPGNYSLANVVAALQFAPQASRYRFVDVEVTHIPVPNPPPPEWSLRDYKQGNFGALIATGATNDRIIFDRCDIHGLDYPGRLGRGLYLNGSNVAVIHSRVHKVNRWGEGTDAGTGSEAAAIDIASGPGPGIIEDNFLEAIGITIFFPNAGKNALPPADYVIRHNLFAHPDTYLYGSPQNWSGKSYANRQIIELKAGLRLLIEGNIFDGNWADVTQGAMVMFTPRAAPAAPPKNITSLHDGALTVAGTADPYTPGLLVSVQGAGSSLDGIWEVSEVLSPASYRLKGIPDGSASSGTAVAVTSNMQISDVDIRNNVFRNGPNLLWINGHDAGITTRTTQRIRFHNNLATGMDARSAAKGGRVSPVSPNRNGRSGIAVFAAFGMEDLIVTNNTIVDFKGNAPHFLFFDSTKNGSHAGLKVSENIFTAENATVASISGGNAGTPALDLQWTAYPKGNWTFDNNVICCNVKRRVDSNNEWPATFSDIGLGGSWGSQLSAESPFYHATGSSDIVGVNFSDLQDALGDNFAYLQKLP